MTLALVAFIAGVLTILAPCILPVLPVVLGGSLTQSGTRQLRRASVIIGSLLISIVLFTLLIKATTTLIGVPQEVWQGISGGIVIALGLIYVFPELWDKLSLAIGSGLGSQKLLAKASGAESWLAPVLTGAALGPVFSSCSPTYAFILAAVLPESFIIGLLYLFLYVLGLGIALFVVVFAGQSLVKKLGWALNPHGAFRRVVGGLFILVGVMVLIGGDKILQEFILDSGLYAPIEHIENSLRK